MSKIITIFKNTFLSNVVLLSIIILSPIISGCGSYSNPVLINANYKMKFHRTLTYEGTVFKPGLYKQADNSGSIKTGLINSVTENIKFTNLFRKIIIKKKNEPGNEKPDRYSLIMRTTTNLILMTPCGIKGKDGCAEMRLNFIIFRPDRINVAYHKTYYIKKRFPGEGSDISHYQTVLNVILTRAIADISKGDFNNPEYFDINYKDIIIK